MMITLINTLKNIQISSKITYKYIIYKNMFSRFSINFPHCS